MTGLQKDTTGALLQGARILVTGGSGSWGNELVRQLLDNFSPKEIRIYSRSEMRQVEMKRKFAGRDELSFIVGDVRDKDRLTRSCRDVDYIFHLAALKHVPVCEENPYEAVETNIIGTQNLVHAALENNVSKMILVSTDKAVDPFNLYGVTKACAEKLVIAANREYGNTVFACVRAGNVIGTAGSVVPLFKNQLQQANLITITDERMTRFFMRVSDAIRLVLETAQQAIGGETFVLKMPACRIIDLAEVMKESLGYASAKTKVIGIRPGEKIHEALVSRHERDHSKERSHSFVILPQILDLPGLQSRYADEPTVTFDEFTSENAYRLSKDEIYELLQADGWLDEASAKKTMDYSSVVNPFSSEGWRPRVVLRQAVLIAGGKGHLGRTFRHIHPEATALGKDELDITNTDSIRAAIKRHKPTYLFNAAGLANIAACELNGDLCHQLNVQGVENLLTVCREMGVKLVHVSSDAALDPVNTYGRSKQESERIVGQDGVVFRCCTYSEDYYVPKTLLSGGTVKLYTNVTKNLISMASFVDEAISFLDAQGVIDIGTTPAMTLEQFGRTFAKVCGISADKIETTQFVDSNSVYKKSMNVQLNPQNIMSVEEDVDRFFHYYKHFLAQ